MELGWDGATKVRLQMTVLSFLKNLLASNEDERMNETFAPIFVKRIFICRADLKTMLCPWGLQQELRGILATTVNLVAMDLGSRGLRLKQRGGPAHHRSASTQPSPIATTLLWGRN